ncbi:MAG: SDR family NAD(P)-dependent oxidoreductase, partial [Cyanobacteria bacterium J06632_22]
MGQPESSNSQPPITLKPRPKRPSTAAQPHPRQRLAGKVALIMGSDGRLDRKIASVYTHQGACVMLCGLHLRRGQALASQIRSAGGEARFLLADVADTADVQKAVAETIATYGHVDILLNNCQPLAQQQATVQTLHPAVWHRTLEASLGGPFLSVHHTLPFLMRTPSSAIINVAPLPDRGPSLA